MLFRSELQLLGDSAFMAAFTTTAESGLDIYLVNDYLASQRWRLNGLQLPAGLHFCVTRPNTQPGVVERFAADLAAAIAYAAEHRGSTAKSGALYAGSLSPEQATAGMEWWLDATQSVPGA